MLSTAFTLKLGHPIESGQVVVGKFDGQNPSIAAATVGGKILLHCPHDKDASDSESSIKFLNFNRKVTAIGAGMHFYANRWR
jgi:Bardet-Biedl syndrome 2 protein